MVRVRKFRDLCDIMETCHSSEAKQEGNQGQTLEAKCHQIEIIEKGIKASMAFDWGMFEGHLGKVKCHEGHGLSCLWLF